MKKLAALILSLFLLSGYLAGANADGVTAGTYEGRGTGFGGEIIATVTVDENGVIIDVALVGDGETPSVGGKAMTLLAEALKNLTDTEGVDAVSGASVTSAGVFEAVEMALAAASGEAVPAEEDAAYAFTPGTYTATAEGYNGPMTVSVTYTTDRIWSISIDASVETAHVGDLAFQYMIPDMLEANGSGVDAVSGATFSSRALCTAMNDTAEQAGCTNLDAFRAARTWMLSELPGWSTPRPLRWS